MPRLPFLIFLTTLFCSSVLAAQKKDLAELEVHVGENISSLIFQGGGAPSRIGPVSEGRKVVLRYNAVKLRESDCELLVDKPEDRVEIILSGVLGRDDCEVQMEVLLPIEMNLDVRTQARGHLDIWGLKGNIQFLSKGGNVRIATPANHVIRGDARSNANIEVYGHSDYIELSSDKGYIRIAGRSGQAKLQSNSGNIWVLNLQDSAEIETRSGNIKVQTGEDPSPYTRQQINIKSESGDIVVLVAADQRVSSALQSRRGKVQQGIAESLNPNTRIEMYSESGNLSIYPILGFLGQRLAVVK